MTFKKIDNEETVTHWVSGAYKIVKYDYRSTGFGAIKERNYQAYNKFYDNKLKMYVSGNYIDKTTPEYKTLSEAKKACKHHALIHPEIAANTDMFYTE
jgi:hypothetical protein